MAEARRVYVVANIRHAFSIDVADGSPSNAEMTDGVVRMLRADFEELTEGLPLIEPVLDVSAVVTSMPIPSPAVQVQQTSPDTEPREEIAH